MNGNILIKPSVQQKFDHVMQSGRILFFSAPCGFGKTVVANALLRKWRTLCLRADAPDFSLQALPDEWDILLIDDFQLLQEQETSQTLCELIRANPARRFVLVSFSEATTPSFAGESKKDYIMKRPSGIMKVRSANCTRKTPGGLLRWKKI